MTGSEMINEAIQCNELVREIKEQLDHHQIIWHDGERFRLSGCRQELYSWLYSLRSRLNDRNIYKTEDEYIPISWIKNWCKDEPYLSNLAMNLIDDWGLKNESHISD